VNEYLLQFPSKHGDNRAGASRVIAPGREIGARLVALPRRGVRDDQVNRMIGVASITGIAPVHRPVHVPPPNVLRRVKRLALYALFACLALVVALETADQGPRLASINLALIMIVVASWAIISQVSYYVRAADERSKRAEESARLEGARLTASAMQDKIANKLSLTVGYSEFLVADPRMPEDLREQAQKAMEGAKAAADIMSDLKRITREEYDAGPSVPDLLDAERTQLRELERSAS
jgi:hypothetical protein